MIERLPEAARKLRQTMSVSRAGCRGSGAEPSVWLRAYAIAQSGLLITVAAQAPIVLLLAYFLMASAVHFRRKLVQFVGPSLSRKKDAVRILEEINLRPRRSAQASW